MDLSDVHRRVLGDYAGAEDRTHTILASYAEWKAAYPELVARGLISERDGTTVHEITDAGRAALGLLSRD